MKKLIKKLFRFIFKEEIEKFNEEQKNIEGLRIAFNYQKIDMNRFIEQLKNTVGNIDVSCDVHESPYAESWAVISIQGKNDYIKFVNLGQSELREIQMFLRKFDRNKIDATPQTTRFIRMS